jgi:NAD(P)-dependent dehydrogenase (short-subunit alcohol dehydrogenase family)
MKKQIVAALLCLSMNLHSQETAIVTGANRGIGLGFVSELLKRHYQVIATYRDEASLTALNSLKNQYPETLSLYQLDVTDQDSIQRFAATVKNVDLLVLNAGIKGYPPGTKLTDSTDAYFRNALEVNTIAPNNLIRAFFPLLIERGNSCVVYISSGVSSTVQNGSGGYPGYRESKEAGNALTWNWSIQLMKEWKERHPDKLSETPLAVAICPGHVKTDMGGDNAPLTVEQSVSAMMDVINYVRKTKKSNGLYMHGNETPYVEYATPAVLKEILDANATIPLSP